MATRFFLLVESPVPDVDRSGRIDIGDISRVVMSIMELLPEAKCRVEVREVTLRKSRARIPVLSPGTTESSNSGVN